LQEKFKAGLLCCAKFFAQHIVCKKLCEQFSRRHSMNNLRQFCAGLILTLALTTAAFAGQIECPGVVQPPPQATVEGEIPNGATVAFSPPTVTDLLLSLIVSVLP
jgi:hypothetical protein